MRARLHLPRVRSRALALGERMGSRRSRLAVVGLVLLAPLCCGGLDTFDISEESTTTVEAGTLLEQLAGDLGFGGFLNMDVSQSEELKNQGVEKEDIDSVRLASLVLEITDPPADQDFGFLESLEVFVEAAGSPRARIARGGPFPAGARRVELAVDEVELEPYATAEAMSVTAEVTGRRPDRATTVKATMELRVDVDVTGVACGI